MPDATIPDMIPPVDYRTPHTADQPIAPAPRLYRSRPGVVTGLGVACIVVAALSGVASAMLGVYGMGSLWFMKMITGYGTSAVYGGSGGPMPGTTPWPPGVAAPMTPQAAPPTGIASPDVRRQIVKAIDAYHRLPASRQPQLDKLLAEVGQSVGIRLKPDGTPFNVRLDLIDSGKAPATQPGEREIDFITTRAGRIEVTETYATFTTTDGSVGYTTAVGTAGFGPVGSSWTLGADEVQQVMTQVQQQSQAQGQPLNPAQLQALQAALQSPSQRLVQPGMAQLMWVNPTVDANGVATVQFNNSAVVIAKQGVVVSTGPAALGVVTTVQQISPEAAALVVFENGMSLALAVFLFVTGILLLRQSPSAARLLKCYAWTKLPLAILGGIAVAWLWGSFSTNGTGAPTDSDQASAVAWGIGFAITGMLLPLAVLAMLMAPGVREFFLDERGVK